MKTVVWQGALRDGMCEPVVKGGLGQAGPHPHRISKACVTLEEFDDVILAIDRCRGVSYISASIFHV